MNKFVSLLVLVFAISCSNNGPKVVVGSDGYEYVLIQPAERFEDGSMSIAEYVRKGDKSEKHYTTRLSPKDSKPRFYEIPK